MTIRPMRTPRDPARVQRTVAPCLLALLTAARGPAYEPRKDEIEYVLPDGSSFILRSTYLWLKPVHKHPPTFGTRSLRTRQDLRRTVLHRPPHSHRRPKDRSARSAMPDFGGAARMSHYSAAKRSIRSDAPGPATRSAAATARRCRQRARRNTHFSRFARDRRTL